MKTNARLILCLIMCAAARTGLCADTAGTGAAPFLDLPVDARSAGMGDAAAAYASGGMALFQNPAGLAGNGVPSFSFSHAILFEGISYDVAGAAVPLRTGVLGAGVQYLRYGSMQALDNTGAAAGSLSPRDSALSLGYGYAFGSEFFLGGAIKSVTSKIAGSASASALDVGLQLGDEQVSVALVLQNMGGGMKFHTEESPLPVNVKLGGYIHYSETWRWAADFNFPQDGSAWLALGSEYAFAKTSDWQLLARAGYNTAALDTKGINGLSAGFGLARRNLSFDYAFKTMGMLGSTHIFSLNYRLDR